MATTRKPAEESSETFDYYASMNEKVRIRLPLIPGMAKQEALFVGCNNRTMVIPRGVETEVPRCMIDIINHAEEAQMEAIRFQEANAM